MYPLVGRYGTQGDALDEIERGAGGMWTYSSWLQRFSC
jgi:hypothetical protein